jgi:hypothetical protein
MKFVQRQRVVYFGAKVWIKFPWLFCIICVEENHIVDLFGKNEATEWRLSVVHFLWRHRVVESWVCPSPSLGVEARQVDPHG